MNVTEIVNEVAVDLVNVVVELRVFGRKRNH